MTDTVDEIIDNNTSPPSSSPPSPSKAKTIVTAEDSIETITDLLVELEEEELPVQTQPNLPTFQPSSQVQPSYFNHRFAIYRKPSMPYAANAPSQLNLFKSFCNSLKSIDPQIQVLPMRNDRQIHPLSTTDQINSIDEIGLLNFFKPYKRTKKTLSGDFHIGTTLTFDELKAHKNFTTWFYMNGYNVMLNSCQTSDMVRIGFLNRVRTFTYRDDLKSHIMLSDQWNAKPFHFRLYFDSFNTNVKGPISYVLMVDVDRPSIETSLKFFQTYFDGDQQNSSNKINYLFFPLFRKSYSDEERKTIIQDNNHHTDGVSIVALTGLNDLNTIIDLNQRIKTTIRHLLLAIPAPGTRTNKLFLQVERQPTNQWLLCCFNSTDATKVTLRLSSLETLLKRYVKQSEHQKLFTSDDCTLKFNGQAAPVRKGKTQKVIQGASEETVQYAASALKKLHTPAPKRLAVEFEQTQDVATTPRPQAVTPAPIQTTAAPPHNPPMENQFPATIEATLLNQNNRLISLEECCSMLAESTKNLGIQITTMNDNIHSRMNEMATAINNIHHPSDQRHQKSQKHNDNSTMDLDLGKWPSS